MLANIPYSGMQYTRCFQKQKPEQEQLQLDFPTTQTAPGCKAHFTWRLSSAINVGKEGGFVFWYLLIHDYLHG